MKFSSSRSSERDRTRALVEHGITLDLTKPPSRASLGLFDDADTHAVLMKDGSKPFQVKVELDGRSFSTSAAQVLVTGGANGGPVTGIDVRREGMSLDQLHAALDAAVTDLGVDPATVADYLDQAGHVKDGDAALVMAFDTDVSGPPSGPVSLQVQPVVVSGGHDAVLLYQLSLS